MDDLIPLRFLQVGQSGQVGGLTGHSDHVQRLHELGFFDGADVEMIQTGTPCIIRLGEKKLGFRETDMSGVLVRPGMIS